MNPHEFPEAAQEIFNRPEAQQLLDALKQLKRQAGPVVFPTLQPIVHRIIDIAGTTIAMLTYREQQLKFLEGKSVKRGSRDFISGSYVLRFDDGTIVKVTTEVTSPPPPPPLPLPPKVLEVKVP